MTATTEQKKDLWAAQEDEVGVVPGQVVEMVLGEEEVQGAQGRVLLAEGKGALVVTEAGGSLLLWLHS